MTRLVFLVVVSVASPARAESPLLAKARAKVEAFELEIAIELLDVLLEDEATSHDDRTAAFALKGRVLVGYGCNQAAVDNYHALLRHEPRFELPATESPKVRQCFEHARATAPPPPELPPEPEPVDLTAKPVPDPVEPAPDPAPGPLRPPGDDDEDSLLTAWWLWAGVAAVATVLGVVLTTTADGEEPIRGALAHETNWPP